MIDGLIDGAREGTSGSLLIRGDPGIGKSSLLRYAAEGAAEFTVLTTAGIESESEFAFSGLSRLLRPLLGRIDKLPSLQNKALSGALSIGPPAGDRLAVDAATLSLLAAAAEEGPVLGLIDDLHWLDLASSQALLFTARRLQSEGIVLLFAARDGADAYPDVTGIPEIKAVGLDRESAHLLLAEVAAGTLSRTVSGRLHRLTEGNPLALVEMVQVLTPEQVSGTQSIDEPLPATATIEQNYRRRVEALPSQTQLLLVLAAASEAAEMSVLAAAARSLGLDIRDLEPAEGDGLVTIEGGRVAWRHPILRSAAYHGASALQRRAVHRALAEAVGDGGGHARAWHLAAAAVEPDESIAAALGQAGLDARMRGGHSAASRAFERAARLSPDDEDRARRLVEAAQDASVVGNIAQATELLSDAFAAARDPRTRADIQLWRSRLLLWLQSPLDAREMLLDEAGRIAVLDPGRATAMLAEAAVVATMTGECGPVLEIARRAVDTARAGDAEAQAIAEFILCNALILTGDAVTAAPLLALSRVAYEGEVGLDKAQAINIHPAAHGSIWVEDYAEARHVLRRAIAAVRSANALFLLPFPLSMLSELDFRTGWWLAAEAGRSKRPGLPPRRARSNLSSYSHICLAYVEAGQGREDDCRKHVAFAREVAEAMDSGQSSATPPLCSACSSLVGGNRTKRSFSSKWWPS